MADVEFKASYSYRNIGGSEGTGGGDEGGGKEKLHDGNVGEGGLIMISKNKL